jgi:two-component system sensor histidine kinase AlgZ
MHPILANRRLLALYLGVWAPFALLLALLYSLVGPAPRLEALAVMVPMAAFYAFLCLSAWYLARALPIQTTAPGRLLLTLAGTALLSSAGWLAMGRAWVSLLADSPSFAGVGEHFGAALPILFAVGVLVFALAAVVHYLLVAAAASREAERRALEMQVLARDAELKALKAQLDPHFLFNSLNSVSALTGSDPQAARRMCLLLAGFLRKSLGLGVRQEIALGEELYLAETFLAIEQVRFGKRLRVESDIAEDTLSLSVPPLLLQPLVENAVRHGIAHLLEGGTVRIEAHRDESGLRLAVINPCDAERPRESGSGLGLRNVRSRLEALFGSSANLVARDEPAGYRVDIVLPARPAAS